MNFTKYVCGILGGFFIAANFIWPGHSEIFLSQAAWWFYCGIVSHK